MVEDEADDGIAAAVARYREDPRVERIVICSVDKDLAQCVEGERIVLRDRMRRITYDGAGVLAKFGVQPESIPDYLALVGDSSDGYPGLAGWGSKSAAAVLRRWLHLDAIPDSAAEWDITVRGAATLAATLREGRAEALLYRRLATLNRDAAVDGELDDVEWRGVPRAEFEALCAELGFDGVTGRVHRWAEA
jgi:5'-3' exonuclease